MRRTADKQGMARPSLFTMALNAVTTADNGAVDPIRLGMVVSGASAIGLAAYDVIINKNNFDVLMFGGGRRRSSQAVAAALLQGSVVRMPSAQTL